jgi:hypothetical protein
MKGKLHKTEQGWVVRWAQEDPRDPKAELPLHPEYQTILPLDLDLEGKEVEFDWCVIVEHYTGKGKEYAKLLPIREGAEYPELEGLNELCKDMIEAAEQQSVPAPDELQEELRRVRSAKNSHVKAQNWELAAAYREVEKLLQDRERKCANCQYMLSAIGVGQGLICELNKCRIPHSEHSCQYHWYGPKVTKSAESASFDRPQTQTVGVKTD